jgi:hypothetical protein
MGTIKIKSTHPESQGDFVVIEEADFVEGQHEHYLTPAEAAAKAKKDEADRKAAEKKEADEKAAIEKAAAEKAEAERKAAEEAAAKAKK